MGLGNLPTTTENTVENTVDVSLLMHVYQLTMNDLQIKL